MCAEKYQLDSFLKTGDAEVASRLGTRRTRNSTRISVFSGPSGRTTRPKKSSINSARQKTGLKEARFNTGVEIARGSARWEAIQQAQLAVIADDDENAVLGDGDHVVSKLSAVSTHTHTLVDGVFRRVSQERFCCCLDFFLSFFLCLLSRYRRRAHLRRRRGETWL